MGFTDFLPGAFSNPRMSTRMSASERAGKVEEALQRAMAGTSNKVRRASSAAARRASTMRERRQSKGTDGPNRDAGPIAGVMSGTEWNNCLQQIYTKRQPTVIHTIILPEGVRPRDLNLKSCKIVDDKRYTLKSGEIPRTACTPAKMVEVFMQPEVCPPDCPMPQHFLVRDTVDGHRNLIDSFKQNKADFLSMGGSSEVNSGYGVVPKRGPRSSTTRSVAASSRAARAARAGN